MRVSIVMGQRSQLWLDLPALESFDLNRAIYEIVRADAIAGLADSFWDFNNVPMVAYAKIGQAIGTFAIPIFVVTNFPALFVLGKMPPLFFAWGFAAPFIFCYLASRLWKAGLKRYASGGN
jgi:ABC-2 type transport system permease protein